MLLVLCGSSMDNYTDRRITSCTSVAKRLVNVWNLLRSQLSLIHLFSLLIERNRQTDRECTYVHLHVREGEGGLFVCCLLVA